MKKWILIYEKEYWSTHAAEIAVQYLDEMMDDLEDFELIVISINAHAEIHAGIPANRSYKATSIASSRYCKSSKTYVTNSKTNSIAEPYLLYTTL